MHRANPSSSDPAAVEPRDEAARKPAAYPHLFRLLHWVLPVAMVVLIATGLSLHATAQPRWSLFAGHLPAWALGGRIDLIHVLAACVFFPSLLATLAMYVRKRVGLRWTHVALLGGGLAMAVTGLLLLDPVGPAWLYTVARLVHSVTGLAVLPIALLWHAVQGFFPLRRLLVPSFHPWASPGWLSLIVFALVVAVSTCWILNVVPAAMTGHVLTAARVDALGDDPMQLSWDDAAPMEIELANGMGFDAGRTRVTLRALHDGRELVVLAEWLDPSEERRYTPWERTAGGWHHQVTDAKDESVYYEDKFALVFPIEADARFERFGCAVYCHADSGCPYGYKGSDKVVDVFHWKASRADPVGQIDDKYWLTDDPKKPTAGRHGDPKTGGGYATNDAKGVDHPAFLPDDPAAVRQGTIPREHAVAYTEELAAQIPAGTIVPGLVVSPFEGDRGDVSCQSQHANGCWRVVIRRKLDTGSEYDVRFVPGEGCSFACAAFDHTSKRHAYNLDVYRLVLEP